MINVGVYDVPILIVLGFFTAVIYRRNLYDRDRYWDLGLTLIITGIWWTKVLLANFDILTSTLIGIGDMEVAPAIAIPFVISYVFWFRFALKIGYVLLGRSPDEGGILWAFRLSDRTHPIQSQFIDSQSDTSEPEEVK